MKRFLIIDDAYVGHNQLIECTPDKLVYYKCFSKNRNDFEDKHLIQKKTTTPIPLPIDLVLEVFDILCHDYLARAKYHMLYDLVTSGKFLMRHFYAKCISATDIVTDRMMLGRIGGVLRCLRQTVERLLSMQRLPPDASVNYVFTMQGFRNFHGNHLSTDWDDTCSWPWGTPFIALQEKGAVVSRGQEQDMKEFSTGVSHLDAVWMVGEPGQRGLFTSTVFKSPVFLFNCVSYSNLSSGNLVIDHSRSIKCWLNMLRVFLGKDCGLYLSRYYSEMEACVTSEVL